MKIVSWNINGIRASKTNLKTLIEDIGSDVMCFQETKVTRDMLDEPTAILDGYNSYFSFSRKRSGYSGVANYCKDSATPVKAEEGLSGGLTTNKNGSIGCYGNQTSFLEDELKDLDAEGRTIITQHRVRFPSGEEKDLAIINVYCPRFDPDREDRHQYKLRFFALLQTRSEAILASGSHVIILGDINTTHRQLDRCDEEDNESHKRPSRLWLNQMLYDKGRDPKLETDLDPQEFIAITPHIVGGKFMDSFRHFYPEKEGCFSNWCTLTNARSTNYGRRLDYILTDVELSEQCLKSASILAHIEGSDHCPVTVELTCEFIPAKTCPPLCTKFMPEFSGKQQKLSTFFTKLIKHDTITINNESVQDAFKGTDVSKGVKRSPQKIQSQPLKKQKTLEVKKGSQGKQGDLMSFFKGPGSKSDTTVNSSQVNDTKNIVTDPKSNSFSLSVTVEEARIKTKTDLLSTSKYFTGDPNSAEIVSNNELENEELVTNIVNDNKSSTTNAWKNILGGLGPAPLCKGHKEPCVLRMVKKPGPNKGKQFYACARGEGLKTNPEARCETFQWVVKKKL
ncbi:DNA-(apurinic or apyrimidinic site) endonuclease 2-like [Dreissena polymorpha]|uniref:DNA-(apurinic or apyrimidinic site) endonuclease 2-like n=1 Tax=Dreissena polymorpha TaxID=45954 RepID=UPI00226406D9|nr:DNA-(apurinic or apyrimidinic site) endonuclease 2-like [Dreissena polymorpha]